MVQEDIHLPPTYLVEVILIPAEAWAMKAFSMTGLWDRIQIIYTVLKWKALGNMKSRFPLGILASPVVNSRRIPSPLAWNVTNHIRSKNAAQILKMQVPSFVLRSTMRFASGNVNYLHKTGNKVPTLWPILCMHTYFILRSKRYN